MKGENICCNTIGQIEDLPETIQKLIHEAIEDTRDNTGMVLTLALSYGGRQEIIDAVKKNCLAGAFGAAQARRN